MSYTAAQESSSPFRYWAFISYSHKDEKWASWLHRGIRRRHSGKKTGCATLRGIKVTATPEEIIKIGREKLVTSPAGARRFESWRVHLDGEFVAPKWLISVVTGLSVSKFRTADALRVLTALGVRADRTA